MLNAHVVQNRKMIGTWYSLLHLATFSDCSGSRVLPTFLGPRLERLQPNGRLRIWTIWVFWDTSTLLQMFGSAWNWGEYLKMVIKISSQEMIIPMKLGGTLLWDTSMFVAFENNGSCLECDVIGTDIAKGRSRQKRECCMWISCRCAGANTY